MPRVFSQVVSFSYCAVFAAQQMTTIASAGNTSSIDKNELNITIEDSQCVTQEDGTKR